MVGLLAEEVKNTFKKKTPEEKQALAERAERRKQQQQENGEHLKNYLPKFDTPWYKQAHLIKLNFLISVISLTSTNTGFDGSLLNGFQAIPDWLTAMHNPTGAILGVIANGVVFGILLSNLYLAPWISDTWGRRNAITIGNIFMIIGTVIQSCADIQENGATSRGPYAQFLIARIILGFGNGIATVGSPTLIAELSYPSHRETCTALFNCNWYLGAIVAAWVTYGTRTLSSNWSWRVPSILQGLFPLIQVVLIYLVPESPRYLVSVGRNAEAREVLLKYHGAGDESIGGALVDFELSEIELAIEQEKIAQQFTYASLFQTPGNRKRVFLTVVVGFMMQMSGNGLVSYYLAKVLNSIGITSTNQQLIFNGGLMIYNYGISIIICLFLFQRVRRRVCFLTSTTSMLVTYVIWTVLSAINQKRNFEDKGLGKGVMAMIFLYYISYNIGLNGLPYLYLTEILPYTIRSKGTNICIVVQQLCSIYNGLVNPIAMDAIEWKYYIVYCCIIAVELVIVYFTFEETSGRTLEEVAEVFGEKITDHDIEQLRLKGETVHEEDQETSSFDNPNKLLV